jgi:hypothetical protein
LRFEILELTHRRHLEALTWVSQFEILDLRFEILELTHRRHLEALTWVSRLKIKQLAPQEP